MKVMIWIMGLVLAVSAPVSFAKGSSGGKKKPSKVAPCPKYGGQDCKDKSNNGHGNNEDGVDRSNPGNSKKGEDTNPDVDDEKKAKN